MKEKLCFVIMGYGERPGPKNEKIYDLDKTYKSIIKPSAEQSGFTCIRGDEIKDSTLIDKSMYALLIHADLVIADITTYNPNAIYELGIRHAARPYSTIIMKDKDGNIPFDINHNRIFQYNHGGKIIDHEETERCQKELTDLILQVDKHKDIDSPFFESITNLPYHKLAEEDYTGLIRELAEKEEHIFGWSEHAKSEMKVAKGKQTSTKFQSAAKLWKKIVDKAPNEPYYIQQQALCTYKSELPSPTTALIDALQIIKQLEHNNKMTNDTESLGITGAIYKNLWLLDKDVQHLKRAIDYYQKGFHINSDYYTGENYALCLDAMSTIILDEKEQIYYKIEARKTRENILTTLREKEDEEDFESRSDYKWICATLANCFFGLGENETAELYQEKFLQSTNIAWEKDTYQKSKALLLKFRNREN